MPPRRGIKLSDTHIFFKKALAQDMRILLSRPRMPRRMPMGPCAPGPQRRTARERSRAEREPPDARRMGTPHPASARARSLYARHCSGISAGPVIQRTRQSTRPHIWPHIVGVGVDDNEAATVDDRLARRPRSWRASASASG